jgi:hypothetical protein
MKNLFDLSQKFFLRDISIFMLLLLIVSSCKKTIEPQVSEVSTDEKVEINIKDGMLVFSSIEDFYKAQNQLSNGINLNIPVDFTSLSAVYQKVVIAENAHQDGYENLSKIERLNYPLHTNTYNEALSSNSIYEYVDTYDGETYTTYMQNTSNHGASKLLNPNGLVIIGNDIVQYNHDLRKIIVGGDVSKIQQLAKVSVSDNSKGIVVSKLKPIILSTQVQERTTPDFSLNCQVDNGSTNSIKWTRKVITETSYINSYDIYYNSWVINFVTKVRAERKNTFGGGWSAFYGTLRLVCSSSSQVGNSSFNNTFTNVTEVQTTMYPHGSFNIVNFPPFSGAPNLYNMSATGTLLTTNPALACTITM